MANKKSKKPVLNTQIIDYSITAILLILILIGIFIYFRLDKKAVNIDKQPVTKERPVGS